MYLQRTVPLNYSVPTFLDCLKINNTTWIHIIFHILTNYKIVLYDNVFVLYFDLVTLERNELRKLSLFCNNKCY